MQSMTIMTLKLSHGLYTEADARARCQCCWLLLLFVVTCIRQGLCVRAVRVECSIYKEACRIGCSITKGTHEDTRGTRHANPCNTVVRVRRVMYQHSQMKFGPHVRLLHPSRLFSLQSTLLLAAVYRGSMPAQANQQMQMQHTVPV